MNRAARWSAPTVFVASQTLQLFNSSNQTLQLCNPVTLQLFNRTFNLQRSTFNFSSPLREGGGAERRGENAAGECGPPGGRPLPCLSLRKLCNFSTLPTKLCNSATL